MMYHMKNIIKHDDKIMLPECMYRVKNPIEFMNDDDINISDQVIKFLKHPNRKMVELEERQNELLKKLDILYDRIKTISVHCNPNRVEAKVEDTQISIQTPEEVVLVISPDCLPWYLNIVLKKSTVPIYISWHIHSSVPNEKVSKIKAFVKNLPSYENFAMTVNLRLIFKCVSADAELKLSSLSIPIVGNVNIIRYLAFTYPNVIPYDHSDYCVDSLLDICHILERTTDKNKEALVNKLFAQHKKWIYGNEHSIVDLAAYNVIKQWRTIPKYVPKSWFDSCEKMCLQ